MKVDWNSNKKEYVWNLNGEPMSFMTESMHVVVHQYRVNSSEREYIKSQTNLIFYIVWLSWPQDPETTIHL